MKKVLSGVAALLMVSSVGFASPLTDYSQGKVAVDLSVRASNEVNAGASYDGKSANFNYGVTVGLGNGFAFQYKQDNADAKDKDWGYGNEHPELQSNQYNVLYQVNPNVSAFVGLTNTKPTNKWGGRDSWGGKNTTGIQVGVIGTVPIGDKTTAYASLGYGDQIEDYEFGLGYALATNWELNVGYKDTKFKKLNWNMGLPDFDYKAHGLTYGVTYKF